MVGQAEDGHGADGLGHPVSGSHLRHRRPRRQVVRTSAHLASLTAAARARRTGLRSPSPEIEVITTHPSRSLFPPTTMMPGCQARRTRRKGYSPDCVEGKFSEVRMQDSAQCACAEPHYAALVCSKGQVWPQHLAQVHKDTLSWIRRLPTEHLSECCEISCRPLLYFYSSFTVDSANFGEHRRIQQGLDKPISNSG